MNDTTLLKDNFRGIQHLGIPVTDLQRSVDFYMRLGFKRILSAEVPENNDVVKVAMGNEEVLDF